MSNVNIGLKIKTQYLPTQSRPADEYFVFAYTITITNHSPDTVQLLTRAWKITDANGKITEVIGEGVVGQQPVIAPGKSFSYTSGAVLKTPIGTMEGHYGMKILNGGDIEIEIPCFTLSMPKILH
ncbi:MAG: uncharacterized protein affecting Mg2+/Co2+ transport ApaG [Idiomarinaceae bacterium HL-53]|nr:MAG: uncharacterized protein affecting Mg2+/Co2+ transport ApaG [Idiomarinaceae bacterium HL-53]CUS48262.1 ApaG protein [Idiomarinaceae bacterium HL-53]